MIPGSNDKASFYMARQPIYDRKMRLVGYELLYRKGFKTLTSEMTAADELNALANVLVEVGLDRLAGSSRAFINVPQSLLGCDALRLLPPDRVTLEILEDTEWTEDVGEQIRDLKEEGYHLALDDYVFEERHEPFLAYVDVVKVDILSMSRSDLARNLHSIRRDHQLYLAEKVESYEDLAHCKDIGFDFFQGYFFSKPNTVRGSGVPANYALSMSLLAKLQDPEINMNELESLIVGNVALCHKVLRLVNCAANGLTRPVESIQQAVLFLGTARIRTLASLAVMTSLPGKPNELYNLAMVRAKFCETLARDAKFENPEKHFTVGLLSVLDALTDLPMEEVISELPLSSEVSDALTGSDLDTPCSRTLRHTLSHEQGEWSQAEAELADTTTHSYLDAVQWAFDQEQQMAA